MRWVWVSVATLSAVVILFGLLAFAWASTPSGPNREWCEQGVNLWPPYIWRACSFWAHSGCQPSRWLEHLPPALVRRRRELVSRCRTVTAVKRSVPATWHFG